MNQLYAQINVKPDTPAKAVAAELTGLLSNGLHRYLEAHPELIQKDRCPTSGLTGEGQTSSTSSNSHT